MPVDEFADIDLGIDEKTFDQLDRAAAKAETSLKKRNRALKATIATGKKAEREQKRLTGRGGIFTEDGEAAVPRGAGPARDIAQLTKEDKKIEKKLDKLKGKVELDSVNQASAKNSLLAKTFGETTANNIFSIGKNPIGFIAKNLKFIPLLGGILLAKEIADFIIDEIIKIDKFLKVFIDEIDNRVDAFRTLQQQADVQAGLTQRIITTQAGTVDPRYSYNTFEEFNKNQTELEERFQMTNNSGVE